jgi:uncharacterized delta-60 repeat protein
MQYTWVRVGGRVRTYAFGILLVLGGVSTAASGRVVGDLDEDYGADFGVDLKALSPIATEAEDVAVQPDGKIVVAGRYDDASVYKFFAARLDGAGNLDFTFGGGDGVVTTSVGSGNSQGQAVIVQSDGKIVVAGWTTGTVPHFALVRYLADGTLDTAFGTGGKIQTAVTAFGDSAYCLAQQPDGALLVGGASLTDATHSAATLVRYLPNGALDTSFGTGGVVLGPGAAAWTIAVLSDGKILAGGTGGLYRFTASGAVDLTFGSAGTGRADDLITPLAMVVQPDGRIAAAGSGILLEVGRWNADGTVDTSFHRGVPISGLYDSHDALPTYVAIARQNDGRVLVTYSTPKPALYAFTDSGALDASYGPFGDGRSAEALPPQFSSSPYVFSGHFTGLAVLPSGKALAVGWGKYQPETGSTQGLLTARYETAGCSGVARAKLVAKKLGPPAGDDGLAFKGAFALPAGTAAAINPAANGIRLISDSSGFDVTIPGGAGWTHNAANTKFSFASASGVQGITKVKVQRSGPTPGQYKLTVVGKKGDFTTLSAPLHAITVSFDVGIPDPDAQCAVAQWPGQPYSYVECTANDSGTKTICK